MTRSVIFKWFTTVQHEEQRAGATVEPGVINVGCYCCAMSVSEKIALGKDGKKLKQKEGSMKYREVLIHMVGY